MRKFGEQKWGISVSAVMASNGNFRLADRLVTQVNLILDIYTNTRLNPEAVDAAREALPIGR